MTGTVRKVAAPKIAAKTPLKNGALSTAKQDIIPTLTTDDEAKELEEFLAEGETESTRRTRIVSGKQNDSGDPTTPATKTNKPPRVETAHPVAKRVPTMPTGGGWVAELTEDQLMDFARIVKSEKNKSEPLKATVTNEQAERFAIQLHWAVSHVLTPEADDLESDALRLKRFDDDIERLKKLIAATRAVLENNTLSFSSEMFNMAELKMQTKTLPGHMSSTIQMCHEVQDRFDPNRRGYVYLSQLSRVLDCAEESRALDYPETARRGPSNAAAYQIAKSIAWEWKQCTGSFPPKSKLKGSSFLGILKVVNARLIQPIATLKNLPFSALKVSPNTLIEAINDFK
jgi:hypothetical protein